MKPARKIAPRRQTGPQAFIKSTVDRVFAAVTIILLFAPMAVIAVLIRVTMGSPVFFNQPRAGRNGQRFTLWKFRTMRNAHLDSDLLTSDRERITRLGRSLRSASLDELPQLWNVLRGELSLVGPRPLLVDYLPLYSVTQRRRHEVMPGITGWAQVNGRNALDWEKKFDLDVWYVDHWSLLLDLQILANTAICVIFQKGISHAGDATMPFFRGSGESRASETLR